MNYYQSSFISLIKYDQTSFISLKNYDQRVQEWVPYPMHVWQETQASLSSIKNPNLCVMYFRSNYKKRSLSQKDFTADSKTILLCGWLWRRTNCRWANPPCSVGGCGLERGEVLVKGGCGGGCWQGGPKAFLLCTIIAQGIALLASWFS